MSAAAAAMEFGTLLAFTDSDWDLIASVERQASTIVVASAAAAAPPPPPPVSVGLAMSQPVRSLSPPPPPPPVNASPPKPFISPKIRERMEMNRATALQRLNSNSSPRKPISLSQGSSPSKPASPLSPDQRQRIEQNRAAAEAIRAAKKRSNDAAGGAGGGVSSPASGGSPYKRMRFSPSAANPNGQNSSAAAAAGTFDRPHSARNLRSEFDAKINGKVTTKVADVKLHPAAE